MTVVHVVGLGLRASFLFFILFFRVHVGMDAKGWFLGISSVACCSSWNYEEIEFCSFSHYMKFFLRNKYFYFEK